MMTPDAPVGADDLTALRDLNTAESKLILLYLVQSGGATVEELQRALGMKLLTLLGLLRTLRTRGFVERRGDVWTPCA